MMQTYEWLTFLDRITGLGEHLGADAVVDRFADRRSAGAEQVAGSPNRFCFERRQVPITRRVARHASWARWEEGVILRDAGIAALTLDHPRKRFERATGVDRAL